MKFLNLCLLAFFSLSAAMASGFQHLTASEDTLVVKFIKKETKTLEKTGLAVSSYNPRLNTYVVKIPKHVQTRFAKPMKSVTASLSSYNDVLYAEPLYRVPPSQISPNDSLYSSQWHLPRLNLPLAWPRVTNPAPVTIAILDTGCDPTHPDLVGKYTAGWNIFDNNSNSADVYGHGTAVAGTAAASSNNGIGVASPAWSARIMPIRISDTLGYGTSVNIANGLIWAADNGAKVANVSYNVYQSQVVIDAARYFVQKGGIVFMSAGNSYTGNNTGNTPPIVVISATNSSNVKTAWSNSGNCIDFAAPGEKIQTTNRGGTYGLWDGTSFSSPMCAGVAALVMSAYPHLKGYMVEDVLKKTATDLGALGYDNLYGFGLMNANAALTLASNYVFVDRTAPVFAGFFTNTTRTISPTLSTLNVIVRVEDNVGVTRIEWLLNGALQPSSGMDYRMNFDVRTWKPGTYTVLVRAFDAAGNMSSVSSSFQK